MRALLLWVLAAVLGAADLVAVAREHHRAEAWLKPLAVVAIWVAAAGTGLLDRPWGIVATIALALGLLGDVLLLRDDLPGRFVAGLAAFLGGHLLYAAAFVMVGLRATPWLVVTGLVALLCLVLSRALLPHLLRTDRGMVGPVAAYMVVLTVAALLGAATGRPLVAVGAALFLVSDTLLAVGRFLRPVSGGHVAVMATYLLAQTGIVGGLALR